MNVLWHSPNQGEYWGGGGWGGNEVAKRTVSISCSGNKTFSLRKTQAHTCTLPFSMAGLNV